jgi:hypothetical protein
MLGKTLDGVCTPGGVRPGKGVTVKGSEPKNHQRATPGRPWAFIFRQWANSLAAPGDFQIYKQKKSTNILFIKDFFY